MRRVAVRAALLVQLALALAALWAVDAAAKPVNGPRETLDQRFTTQRPNAPTGTSFKASYHAAGTKNGNPPYLVRMIFYPPRGMRYDTSVPARCSAPDPVLQVAGPDACPPGSRVGGGTVDGIFYEPIGHSFMFDRYHHTVDVMNNANEQIVLVKAEGYSVTRGKVHSDSSVEFNPPTCFPTPPTGQCVDDYVLQLKAATILPAYTKRSNGFVRSYATTPPRCPATGFWRSTIKIWWRNGKVDSVVTKQPCRRLRRARG